MTGTYYGRSRHRLPRREGARIAGRTGGVPQYVPADMYRCVPTCHGIPAKAFQVSFPAAHLPRFSCESVPGVFHRRPPGTLFLRKRSRCLIPPPTCHGGSSHHGMLVFFSRAYGCFQHEVSNHQHTSSCGIHASV